MCICSVKSSKDQENTAACKTPSTLRPSSVLDFGAGSEGEGLLSGLVHPEEGQPAEEPGDQPGAEERGVHQTGEPAQEGSEM